MLAEQAIGQGHLADDDMAVERVSGHCLANEKERQYFEAFLGKAVVDYLTSLGAHLYVDPSTQQTRSRDAEPRSGGFWERLMQLLPANYELSEFATVIDGRVVLISTFLKRRSKRNTALPDKITQIDFVFLEDWNNDEVTSINSSYLHKIKEVQQLGGKGLLSEGVSFLKKMKKLVEVIDPNCLIRLRASDQQRKRIYEFALKGNQNVQIS